MQGGLHTEIALCNTIGDYLEDSGWTTALTNADITSAGKADSFLKTSHLARTRHSHQVSALALAQLEEEAFLSSGEKNDVEARQAWIMTMIEKSPTFQYWSTILKMEITGLIFVRAHREQNFTLYVESMKEFTPWFCRVDRESRSVQKVDGCRSGAGSNYSRI